VGALPGRVSGDWVREDGRAGCSARDFAIDWNPTHGYGSPSTLGTKAVDVLIGIRNVGATCTFHLPETIEALDARGVSHTIEVVDTRSGMSDVIPRGAERTIMIRAWWRITGFPGLRPFTCKGPIANVTRVAITFSIGDLPVALGTVWHTAWTSPASTSIENVKLGGYEHALRDEAIDPSHRAQSMRSCAAGSLDLPPLALAPAERSHEAPTKAALSLSAKGSTPATLSAQRSVTTTAAPPRRGSPPPENDPSGSRAAACAPPKKRLRSRNGLTLRPACSSAVASIPGSV
jgi:hypothetical protein